MLVRRLFADSFPSRPSVEISVSLSRAIKTQINGAIVPKFRELGTARSRAKYLERKVVCHNANLNRPNTLLEQTIAKKNRRAGIQLRKVPDIEELTVSPFQTYRKLLGTCFLLLVQAQIQAWLEQGGNAAKVERWLLVFFR